MAQRFDDIPAHTYSDALMDTFTDRMLKPRLMDEDH